MTDITIYHNPRCSKSRQTLALLEQNNCNIKIIKYLDTPPSIEQLQTIIQQLGFSSARELIRVKEEAYKALALKNETNEANLLKAMVENPKLIERPIVIAKQQARIGRPPESVLDIIDR